MRDGPAPGPSMPAVLPRQAVAEQAAARGGMRALMAGAKARLSLLTWMAGASVGLTALALGGSVMLYLKLCEVSSQLAQLSRLMH